jgi:hypothetical protein
MGLQCRQRIAEENNMADTGEDREIKTSNDAKEAEDVAESKKLLQESIAATEKALSKRRRQTRQETVTPGRW